MSYKGKSPDIIGGRVMCLWVVRSIRSNNAQSQYSRLPNVICMPGRAWGKTKVPPHFLPTKGSPEGNPLWWGSGGGPSVGRPVGLPQKKTSQGVWVGNLHIVILSRTPERGEGAAKNLR